MRLSSEVLFRLLLAVSAAAMLTWNLWLEFAPPPENWTIAHIPYGTAWAPYSDALGPWLDGALSYYMHHVPVSYLYRPVVGVFYGSIIAATGQISLIPVFFWSWLLAVLAGLILFAPIEIAVTLAVWSVATSVYFADTLKALCVGSLLVDGPAFVLSFIAILSIAGGLHRRHMALLSTGFLVLGIVAAIRGALLPAVPALLFLSAYVMWKEKRGLWLATCGFLAISPIAADITVQARNGIVNNGYVNMYCFYSDPIHMWTPQCDQQYVASGITPGQVAKNYLRFFSTGEGLKVMLIPAADRLNKEAYLLTRGPFLCGITFLLFFNLLRKRFKVRRSEAGILAGAVLFIAALNSLGFAHRAHATMLVAGLILFILVSSIAARRWPTAVFLISYLAGMLLLSLLGLERADRIVTTISFLFYLGVFSFFAGTAGGIPDEAVEGGRGRNWKSLGLSWLSGTTAAAVLFLYSATWFQTGLRRIYDQQVRGRQAALKISNDPALNRSLYYTGDRQLLYTFYDPAPVRSVRVYTGMDFKGSSNISFEEPGRFID